MDDYDSYDDLETYDDSADEELYEMSEAEVELYEESTAPESEELMDNADPQASDNWEDIDFSAVSSSAQDSGEHGAATDAHASSPENHDAPSARDSFLASIKVDASDLTTSKKGGSDSGDDDDPQHNLTLGPQQRGDDDLSR